MSKRRRGNDGGAIPGGGGGRKGWYYPYGKYAKKYRTAAIERAGPRGSATSVAFWGADRKSANPMQLTRRELMRYAGKGDYRRYARWVPRGIGALAGGFAGLEGGVAGVGVGAARGWGAGAGFSKALGWGDYSMADGPVVNSLVGPRDETMKISVNPMNNSGDIIFAHTEFIRNITITSPGGVTQSPFQIDSFPLNAGQETTFPFLAQLAKNFTLYEFQGCMFQFKPTQGEGATSALGKVIMCTDYDPDTTVFHNSQQMENYDYASSAKPTVGQVHGVETAPSQRSVKMLYVRTGYEPPGPAANGKDRVFTDLGLFQVATEGIQIPATIGETTIVGELWVSYKVRLSRAHIDEVHENTGSSLSALKISGSVPPHFASSGTRNSGIDDITTATYGAEINMNGSVGCTVAVSTDAAVQKDAARITWPPRVTQQWYLVSVGVPWVTSAGTRNDGFRITSYVVTNGTPVNMSNGIPGLENNIYPGGASGTFFRTADSSAGVGNGIAYVHQILVRADATSVVDQLTLSFDMDISSIANNDVGMIDFTVVELNAADAATMGLHPNN